MSARPPIAPFAEPALKTVGAGAALLDLKGALRALGTSGGSASAVHLLGLLCEETLDSERLVNCLRGEPSMAARVLKVANSPFYGQCGRVGTVERAVQLLGLAAIRGIAATGCLDRTLPGRMGRAFDPERFRCHSLAVACAAQRLSQALKCDCDGEAFIAGLLHDIGVLVLARGNALAMQHFVPQAGLEEASLLQAERDHFGADHAACACLLAEAWSLPAWLQAALAAQHPAQPYPVPAAGQGMAALPALLALSDTLAHRSGFSLWAPEVACTGAQPGLPDAAEFGLSPEALQHIEAELPQAVAALSLGP